MDAQYLDLQSSRFFNSLPEHLKESIMQSGLDFKNEQDLREFASKYQNSQK